MKNSETSEELGSVYDYYQEQYQSRYLINRLNTGTMNKVRRIIKDLCAKESDNRGRKPKKNDKIS